MTVPFGGLDRSLLSAISVFRWVAWAWMAFVLAASNDELGRPGSAALLTGAALA
nr:hypothetical protein [Acidimicrobiia bacterium]